MVIERFRMDRLVVMLQYLPIVLITSIPLISVFYHLIFTSLKSPIHFQQGIESISPGRSALAQSAIAISPLICILSLLSVPQLYFYSIGYIISLLLSALLISSVLHYIPSPSICQYLKLRYQSNFLRIFIVTIESVMLITISVMLLTYSTLYMNDLMKLLLSESIPLISLPMTVFIVCSVIAILSAFSMLFSGQSAVSQGIFYCPFLIIFIGSLLLLCKGIVNDFVIFDELNLLQSIFVASNWSVFSLGILNGLHLIIANPLLYQQYFALNTNQQLRSSLLLHSLVFIMLLLSIISMKCLLLPSSNEDNHASLLMSCTQIFQQIILNMKNIVLINNISNDILNVFIVVFPAVIINYTLSLTLMTLTSFVWEELIRYKFYTSNQRKQLFIVQMILLLITVLVTISAIAFIHHYVDYFTKCVQFALLSLSVVAAPITAIFLCSFIFSFNNWKGALTGLLLGYLTLTILMVIRLQDSVISIEPLSNCDNTINNDNSTNNIIPMELNHMDNVYYDGNNVNTTTLLSIITSTIDTDNNSDNVYGDTIDNDQITNYDDGNNYLNNGNNNYKYDRKTSGENSFIRFMKDIPFTLYPLIGFSISFFTMMLVSLITGGEDILSINLNLLIWPSFTNIIIRSNDDRSTDHPRRAFVECESFRYAQQTPYPDTKYIRVRTDDGNTIVKNPIVKQNS